MDPHESIDVCFFLHQKQILTSGALGLMCKGEWASFTLAFLFEMKGVSQMEWILSYVDTLKIY